MIQEMLMSNEGPFNCLDGEGEEKGGVAACVGDVSLSLQNEGIRGDSPYLRYMGG